MTAEAAADDEADSSSKTELSGSNLEASEYVLKLWRYSGEFQSKLIHLVSTREHVSTVTGWWMQEWLLVKAKLELKKEKDEFIDKRLPQPQFYPQRELSSQSQDIQNITKYILQKKILM